MYFGIYMNCGALYFIKMVIADRVAIFVDAAYGTKVIYDGRYFSTKEILEKVPPAQYDDTIVEWCHWVDINQWLPI